MNITAPIIYFALYRFQAPSYCLANVYKAKEFNKAAIESINMRQLGESIAYSVPNQLKAQGESAYHDEGGVSCMSLLSTSGIEIHTWPDIDEKGKVRGNNSGVGYASVQSCRDFHPENVMRILIDVYSAKNIKLDKFYIDLNQVITEEKEV